MKQNESHEYTRLEILQAKRDGILLSLSTLQDAAKVWIDLRFESYSKELKEVEKQIETEKTF